MSGYICKNVFLVKIEADCAIKSQYDTSMEA